MIDEIEYMIYSTLFSPQSEFLSVGREYHHLIFFFDEPDGLGFIIRIIYEPSILDRRWTEWNAFLRSFHISWFGCSFPIFRRSNVPLVIVVDIRTYLMEDDQHLSRWLGICRRSVERLLNLFPCVIFSVVVFVYKLYPARLVLSSLSPPWFWFGISLCHGPVISISGTCFMLHYHRYGLRPNSAVYNTMSLLFCFCDVRLSALNTRIILAVWNLSVQQARSYESMDGRLSKFLAFIKDQICAILNPGLSGVAVKPIWRHRLVPLFAAPSHCHY